MQFSISKYIFFIFFYSFSWMNEPHFVGEELTYSATFRLLPAGEAKLFFSYDSLNGKPVYKLSTYIQTNSFLDAFYKIRDEIHSWLSPKNFSLKKITKNISEGNYHSNFESLIQGDSIAISGNYVKKIPGKVYDPIAFVYFLREQNLSINNHYNFFSYSKKKIREIIVHVTSIETIDVSAGTFKCKKIEPLVNNGEPLLKNNGQMRIWISDDSLRLPVQIEQSTNIGTMIMKLKKTTYHSY